MESEQKIPITITTGTLVRVIVAIFIAFAVYELRSLFLIILTAVVIASSVERGTLWLARYKISRVWAVLLIYISFFILLFATLSFLLPPLFQDLSDLATGLPARLNSIGQLSVSVDPLSSITGGLAHSFALKDIIVEMQKFILKTSDSVFHTASVLFGGFFSFILILVISFYLSVQERGIESFLRIITPFKSEKYILDLWSRAQTKIGLWFQGQILLGLIVGLLVFLGLSLLHIRYALTLGILTAVFEIIPFFGPILSAIPGVLLGFGEGSGAGLLVLALYLVVQQCENHVIYPLVVKKIIGVPPLVVILSLLIGAQLAGFLGMIISVPMATVIMELVSDIEKRKAIWSAKSD